MAFRYCCTSRPEMLGASLQSFFSYVRWNSFHASSSTMILVILVVSVMSPFYATHCYATRKFTIEKNCLEHTVKLSIGIMKTSAEILFLLSWNNFDKDDASTISSLPDNCNSSLNLDFK
jgi:hypothetical protein